MNKKTTLPLLCGLIFYCAGTFPAFGQERAVNLQDKRITIQMEKQPLGMVFRYLMKNYDIPIGFEQSSLDKYQPDYDFEVNFSLQFIWARANADGSVRIVSSERRGFIAEKHPITVHAENERLEEVFNRIVPQMENYKWEINDGVVNIFPAKGRDERFEQLLGLQIEKFALAEGATIMDITENIKLLPGFFSFQPENEFSFLCYRYRGSSYARKAQYGKVIGEKLEFSNLTLRELLNKCTKIKRGSWTLRWVLSRNTPEGWEYIGLDI